jgi:DNA-binding NtrC family response regulator
MKVLIIDADANFRDNLAQRLSKHGLAVSMTDDAKEARAMACRGQVDAMLVGLSSPKQALLSFLREIRQDCPKIEVMLINHSGDVQLSIDAMKHGAFAEIDSPVDIEELLRKITAMSVRKK